jgi:hypothetical protein
MLTAAALFAALLYLAPVALFLVMRAHRDRPLWAIALDVPVAISIDLLTLLALALAMRLETAVFVSRAGWLVAATVSIARRVRRRDRPTWPRSLGARDLAAAVVATVLAVILSVAISRVCHIWDRAWHIPLVSSLRGQRLPFHNVYQPDVQLEYHYTGDVIGAALQTLSGARIHSSLALSLAHDVLFGLFGCTAALLLRSLGLRSVALTVLGALAPLVNGPLSLFLQGAHKTYRGYNFLSLYVMSYRPHCALAVLLILGFVGAAIVALRPHPKPTGWATSGVLVACAAALTLTDEASTGLLGLALGAAWLIAPWVVHRRRWQGAAVFAALLAAVVVPHLLFGGAIGPGALRQHVVWVPWRSPGYYTPAIPFTNPAGISALLRDVLPLALLAFAAIIPMLRRQQIAVASFAVVVLAASLFLLCRIEVRADVPLPSGGFAGQNHRFMTAALVAGPLLAAAAVLDWSALSPRTLRRGLAVAIGLASVALSAGSTFEWLKLGSRSMCAQPSKYGSRQNFFETDCRREAGARLGADARPAYGAFSILYVFAGCHPSYVGGPKDLNYRLKIGLAASGPAGLRDAAGFVGADAPLRVVCSTHGNDRDALCRHARDHGSCKPLGEKLLNCSVSPEERTQLLAAGSKAASTVPPPPAPERDAP